MNVEPDIFNNYFIKCIKDIKVQIDSAMSSALSSSTFLNKVNENLVTFSWKQVTPKDVLCAVRKMNRSESLDLYNISNNLLKSIVPGIAEPLAHCINSLLNEGTFPNFLKISRVCPIYKNGPRNQPHSYRPISVIPVIGKLIELIVNDQIYTFLESNNVLSKDQFGFRRGKSTADALDGLVRQVVRAYEDKSYAQVTFCDLSKAFDCVDRDKLVIKLKHYGLQGSVLNFVKSYLENRKQIVIVNGNRSKVACVEWGVPQGSVLALFFS